MGGIGKQVAKRARGFDMKVLYHNRKRDLVLSSILEPFFFFAFLVLTGARKLRKNWV
jgi:lactate dehydrogenase-like 2-hydroxyacid dehydrogenase